MSLMGGANDVMREPPSGRFLFVTLILAYLIYLLPADGVLVYLRAELPLIVLMYWCIHQPRHGGFAIGFVLGLLVDVADGNILGQHALSYTLAIFLTLVLRLRILKFPLWQQALHILAILFVNQLLVALTHLFLPSTFPGGHYFLASFVGALLWPVIVFALEYPQLLATRAHND
ncbi:MAG: rod shape-determining protein MreD [Burkholderiales bacterium]